MNEAWKAKLEEGTCMACEHFKHKEKGNKFFCNDDGEEPMHIPPSELSFKACGHVCGGYKPIKKDRAMTPEEMFDLYKKYAEENEGLIRPTQGDAVESLFAQLLKGLKDGGITVDDDEDDDEEED